MSSMLVWLGIIVVFSVLMSYGSIKSRMDSRLVLFDNFMFCAGVVLVWFAMAYLTIRCAPTPLHARIVTLILMGVTFAFVPFIIHFIGITVTRARVTFTSMDHAKPIRTYDLAEKAEHEKNFKEAIRQYGLCIAKFSDDPEPWRRVAEIHLLLQEYEPAIKNLEEALNRIEDEENKLLVGFRISDVLDQKLHQPERARKVLEKLATEIHNPTHVRLIKDRLKTVI